MNIRRQSGFLSAEALLGVTMITGALALGTKFVIDQEYQTKAESAGQTMQTVTQALNAYLAETFEVLSNQRSTCDVIQATTSPTTFATDQAANPTCTLTTPPATAQPLPLHLRNAPRLAPGVQATSAAAEGCGLTGYCWRATDLTFLSDAGKLPAGFSNRDQYGNTLNVVIRVSGTAPNWTVDAIVVTSGAIKRNDRISIEDAGTAAAVLGADGGVVRFATADDLSIAAAETPPRTLTEDFIYGFGNASGGSGRLSWVMERTDWLTPFIEPGQLVARAGYQSSTWSSYLRRDGTLPMTGNLDMGGNTIKGLKNVIINELCDGKDEFNNPTGHPDYTGSVASTAAGQILTCRVIAGYNKDGVIPLAAARPRWAKSTPGYTTYTDVATGAMNGVMSAPMYMFTNSHAPAGAPTWAELRMLLKHVPAGSGIYVPDGGNSLGTNVVAARNDYNTGGETGAFFVLDSKVGTQAADTATVIAIDIVAGPFRVATATGEPIRWRATNSATIPATRNTIVDALWSAVVSTVNSGVHVEDKKDWTYVEWLFSSSGIDYNVYTSTPISPRNKHQPGWDWYGTSDLTLTDNSASVTVKDCTTTITPPDPVTGLGGGSSTSCVDIQRPVTGGDIQGQFSTPYSFSGKFVWQTNFFGRVCNSSTGSCWN